MIIFDIETGPQPEEVLRKFLKPIDRAEFEVGEYPAFDPACVKYGNAKAEDKRQAILMDAQAKHEAGRAAHEQLAASVDERCDAAMAEALAKLVEDAPLNAIWGKVEAIGLLAVESGNEVILEGDERTMIATFWQKVESEWKPGGKRRKFCGHYITGFDLPFLLQRSWLLDIPVGLKCFERDRWLNTTMFADTHSIWTCGQYGVKNAGIDPLSIAFGGAGKPDDCTGATFWQLWRGTEEEKERARNYLLNDLRENARIATAMGLV